MAAAWEPTITQGFNLSPMQEQIKAARELDGALAGIDDPEERYQRILARGFDYAPVLEMERIPAQSKTSARKGLWAN